jgi:hypothetical protein
MLYVCVFQGNPNVPLQATTLHTLRKYYFSSHFSKCWRQWTTFQMNIAGLNEIRKLYDLCRVVFCLMSLCVLRGNWLHPFLLISLVLVGFSPYTSSSFFFSSYFVFLLVVSPLNCSILSPFIVLFCAFYCMANLPLLLFHLHIAHCLILLLLSFTENDGHNW